MELCDKPNPNHGWGGRGCHLSQALDACSQVPGSRMSHSRWRKEDLKASTGRVNSGFSGRILIPLNNVVPIRNSADLLVLGWLMQRQEKLLLAEYSHWKHRKGANKKKLANL